MAETEGGFKILCEECANHFNVGLVPGDEGCSLKCPNCGQKGILYMGMNPDYQED